MPRCDKKVGRPGLLLYRNMSPPNTSRPAPARLPDSQPPPEAVDGRFGPLIADCRDGIDSRELPHPRTISHLRSSAAPYNPQSWLGRHEQERQCKRGRNKPKAGRSGPIWSKRPIAGRNDIRVGRHRPNEATASLADVTQSSSTTRIGIEARVWIEITPNWVVAT